MRGRALEASARGKAPGASVRDPAGRKRGARVVGPSIKRNRVIVCCARRRGV